MTSGEEAQLVQTVEMFEVITQTQPQDYQSLEILKEAYFKLGREEDVIRTSKRIAEAYVMMGQLSSAILEYEGILQRYPEDPDVLAALSEIESKANSLTRQDQAPEEEAAPRPRPETTVAKQHNRRPIPTEIDDGRQAFSKLFVDGKHMTQSDFQQLWPQPDLTVPPTQVCDPFIQIIADKGLIPLDRSLRLVSDKARLGFLPLAKYDYDMDLARIVPPETCLRWCVLPVDRMSKSVLVATANPFNRQAANELEDATQCRLVSFLAPPVDIIKALRKLFR